MNPPPELAAPDRSLRWMPDHFVPLAHGPLWPELPETLRLRLNQGQACLHLELFAFFETHLRPAFELIAEDASVPKELRDSARLIAAEETAHSAHFARLWELARPGTKAAHLPGPFVLLMRHFSTRPDRWPFCFLLQALFEERSLFFGQSCLREASLDETFRRVQRWHLADEAGHVPAAGALFVHQWEKLSPPLRRRNASVFGFLVRNFFFWPGKSSRQVIIRVCGEDAAWAVWKSRLLSELKSLRHNENYRATIYPLDELPRFRRLVCERPEFTRAVLSPWLLPRP